MDLESEHLSGCEISWSALFTRLRPGIPVITPPTPQCHPQWLNATRQHKLRFKFQPQGVPVMAQWLKNPTTNHGCGLDPWPPSVGWGSGVALSCVVGYRCGSDPTLLWLWCRPAAAAPIGPLAWEPPYAAGAALKRQKDKNKTKQNKNMLTC